MLELDLYINDNLILRAQIVRLSGEGGQECTYSADVELATQAGEEREFEFELKHNHSEGAEVLARKALERIIEKLRNEGGRDCEGN